MKHVALSSLISAIESGARPRGGVDTTSGDIPSLGGEHLNDDGGFNLQSPKLISSAFFYEMSRGHIKKNDILIVKDGATTGKTSFVGGEFPFKQAAINEHVFRVEINEAHADARYIFHFLHSPKGKASILKDFRGATVGGIGLSFPAKVLVPLPSLEEQKRIAAILDKADALRRKRRQALALLDGLTQSIFLEMFGCPGKNPKGWPLGKIGDLLRSVNYGTSDKAGDTGAFPILRMGNLTSDGKIDLQSMKYINLQPKEIEKYTVKSGDILFNRTNSIDLVGKTAVYRQSEPRAFAGYLIRARTNEKASPEYISAFLNSSVGKGVLRGMAKNIVGMANINAKEMQSIVIPVPPRALQELFSKRVNSLATKRRQAMVALSSLDALFASLQHRAFNGEL